MDKGGHQITTNHRTMKQIEEPEQWCIQHPSLARRVTVTQQAWMTQSTRKDWEAEKWRQLHYRDSEAVDLAKHNNASMQRHLQENTRLLERQRRSIERQHVSLQRQVLTDNLRHRLRRQEKSPLRRKSLSHENLQSKELADVDDSVRQSSKRQKARSMTADCQHRVTHARRERAHTMDNMYLSSRDVAKSNEHLPSVSRKNPTVSKWSSMTDITNKDKWLNDLINHLPPDLYAQSQAPSRERRQKRLRRMLSRSHEECRSLGTTDSRFVNLTAVLVKQ